MKFFTPELYLRFSAPNKADADRSDAEWEEAVSGYHTHLSRFSGAMNDRVRTFSEDLCLHDAELLALQEVVASSPTLPPTQTPIAIVSLRGIGRIFNLLYLAWGEIALSAAPQAWPFSPIRLHWLCDEIDLDREPSSFRRYHHRVLLSDGRVIRIPFYDVIVHSFSEKDPEPVLVARKKA